MKTARCVTIIVPVYGDWSSLSDCIDSLIQYVNHDLHKVLFINDMGPEASLMARNIQNKICKYKNMTYQENKKNLGFVGACNRAVFELDKTNNDILLLNSDTKVTPGFLEEMISVLYADKAIGVVSPRSNNATLVTVPLSAATRKGIKPIKSFKIYQAIKDRLPRYYVAPVAHGFCMLTKRILINKYGLFDQIFGKGYGEEVDYCLRLKANGYLSAICNQAYVFHMEARSFSPKTKATLLENNNKIIWQRFPDYRQDVRNYMEQTIAQEQSTEESLGLATNSSKSNKLKQRVKNNSYLYNIVKKISQYLFK